MRNKKILLLSLVAILLLVVTTGCGSGDNQAAKPAPATTAKPASSMPNEDPGPIAQDLERKLKDTGTMINENKWAEAKLIVSEALKTTDRLSVHITDPRMKEQLRKSIQAVDAAVKASPADQKSAAAAVSAALEAVRQAAVQLQGHKHH